MNVLASCRSALVHVGDGAGHTNSIAREICYKICRRRAGSGVILTTPATIPSGILMINNSGHRVTSSLLAKGEYLRHCRIDRMIVI